MKRLMGLVSLAFLLLTAAGGQYTQAPPRTVGPLNGRRDSTAATPENDQMREMEKKRQAERQKQLRDDTTKLLQLATDLKASVDKTNKDILSLDVVKRAEEIEKLAKRIKTNMRDEAK